MIPSTINLCGLSFYCSDGFNAANLQNFSCHSTSEEKDLQLISDQPDFVLNGNSLELEQAIYKDVDHDKPTTKITAPAFSQTSQFLIIDADTRKATKIIVQFYVINFFRFFFFAQAIKIF